MEKYLEMINKLLELAGDVKLSEAKSWLEVEANAEALRKEGHEDSEDI